MRAVRPPSPAAARVRHRSSRREGRVSPESARSGEVRVLFDGDSRSRSVPAHAVEYLDASGPTPEPTVNAHTPVPAAADPSAATDLVDRTADLVAAYVAGNRVAPADMPGLIGAVGAGMAGLGQSGTAPVPAADDAAPIELPTPAEIRRSIRDDGLVSFLDGRSYKTLKRHLSKHGLTPERYRARYGLPADYPIVAPGYSAQRSELAKAIGLGVPGGLAPTEDAA